MDLQNAGEVSVEHDGKEYTATYIVESGVIKVGTAHKRKYGRIGFLPPEAVACIILREMIKDGDV